MLNKIKKWFINEVIPLVALIVFLLGFTALIIFSFWLGSVRFVF